MVVTSHHPLRGRILLALFLIIASWALLSQAAAFPDWTDCPAVCKCKWSSGKKSAICPDAGLTSLPASLDPDMQVLDLSGNKIPALQSEIFKRAGLLNLQRVFLRNAGIHEIHPHSFTDMRILVEIDLSDNHLTHLEPNTFLGNERLRILVLSGNPLGTLRSHQFPVLQHLRTLELQECSLTEVHSLALAHLTGLETLRLDGNALSYLDETVISSLARLKTLSLDGNRWVCDCRLRSLRSWLIPELPKKLYSASQVCQGPSRLKGRRWEEVKPTEFACEPQVYVLASTVQEESNGNVSLACLATGDPEPEIWWQLNGGPLNSSRSPFADGYYTTPSSVSSSFVDGGLRIVYSSENKRDSMPIANRNSATDRWSNMTIYNASDSDAGEYACYARNIAGMARDAVSVAIPRVYTAPTLSQSDNWLLWVSLAGGGATILGASVVVALVAICLCGSRTRRTAKREKMKLQGSTSFNDQEKKLLDLSVTTSTACGGGSASATGSRNGNDHGSLAEVCGDLELAEHGSICDPIVSGSAVAATAVTVERLRHETSSAPLRAVPCATAAIFPPPPPEFTSQVLPAGIFGNIYISVALPQDNERCYPDLLDIPVHGPISADPVTEKLPIGAIGNSASCAPGVSSFATLPRRALRATDLGSPYDNMGPRVTANGSSSAFSLTDMDVPLSPPPPPRVIQPPHEFVSL